MNSCLNVGKLSKRGPQQTFTRHLIKFQHDIIMAILHLKHPVDNASLESVKMSSWRELLSERSFQSIQMWKYSHLVLRTYN